MINKNSRIALEFWERVDEGYDPRHELEWKEHANYEHWYNWADKTLFGSWPAFRPDHMYRWKEAWQKARGISDA